MLYEYKKGVRRLAMYTCSEAESAFHLKKLRNSGIAHVVSEVSNGNVNIFFGDCPCISIVESFGKKRLNDFDEKEDFILGVLLGYDITKQCERYMNMLSPEKCQSCAVSGKFA